MSLSLGQSENYINMIENKKNLPSMTMFLCICEYLEVLPSEFFDESRNNPKLLNEISKELEKMEDTVLNYFLGIAKEINKKR